MTTKLLVVLSVFAVSALAQRSPYAGRRPIGYPAIEITPSPSNSADDLGNRLGDDAQSTQSTPRTTTQRLPIEALGDRDLVNRLSKLPMDKQPFWYINWQALEQHRRNPQTYPQKVNNFLDNGASRIIFME